MPEACAITLRGVSKSYGNVSAVSALDLAVPHGSVYGFLGPNGSGKTTTIRMIMAILLPDEGAIEIEGMAAGKTTQDRIGYLPEERGLYPKMKVGELLQFFAELKSVPADEARRRIDYWLERVGLVEWRDKKINELSKGMQQKVQFIVSAIADPPILILDEPSSGLDPINANLLKDILLELRNRGKTILFSTHRMEEAERLCDHVCLISHGRKVLDGPMAEVRASGSSMAIRVDYRGSSAALAQAPGVIAVDDYGNYAELKIDAASRAPDIIRYLAPRADITRFELLQPTLNQIFLEKVGAAERVPEEERGLEAQTHSGG